MSREKNHTNIDYIKIIDKLLEHGIDINAKSYITGSNELTHFFYYASFNSEFFKKLTGYETD